MRFSTSAVLVTMLGWIGAAAAHNIQLKAHSRECFHEKLHKDDKMTVTFQVGDREFGGSGNLEIDFWVCVLYMHFPVGIFCLDFVPNDWPLSDIVLFFQIYRSKIPLETVNITRTASRLKTTLSPRSAMENLPTASVTRPGHRILKRFHSMCMELFTFPKQRWCRIPSKLKVWILLILIWLVLNFGTDHVILQFVASPNP